MSSQEFEDNSPASESMHAEEDSPGPGALPAEKRRRVRACDMCRRRKVRCDGGRMSGNQCSNCQAFKYTCTYTQASKQKRFADPEYVQNLETQLARTQDLLQKLSSRLETLDPHGGISGRGFSSGAQSPSSDSEQSCKPSQNPTARIPNMASFDPTDEDLDPSDDEMKLRHNLERSIKHLSLETGHPHFLGKSSGLLFLQTALDMKEEYVSGKYPPPGSAHIPLAGARPEYWSEDPWITQPEFPYPIQVFPEPALMQHLVSLYFEHHNIYMPVLHRPTFEKGIREGLHLIDEGFGATVLLTCALGAQFSDDPRVLLDGVNNVHSSGWKWFHHVQTARKAFRLAHPCLYDLQIACLVGQFLHSSSAPQFAFSIVGAGIRTAQDLGAHRRKVYATMSQADGELLKRAFWVLLALDRSLSSALGRACCIQDEDFDVDYPLEIDDEYWFNDDPELAFKQPPGKPSLLSFFTCLIRLNQIHGCVLRTIYAINKSKILLGFSGPDWEQHIVTELDSALNKWVDTVPDHLKWDPHMENLTFLDQSAFLYTTYYILQITIHRPYIPSPRKPSPLSFPSLAICTNAARSCIHVLDVQYHRSSSSSYQNMMALFCSAVVLLLNIWGGKRAGTSVNMTRELTDVHKVMTMLKALEPRWHTAGRVLDILCELASAGGLPLPQMSSTLKRARESSNGSSSTPSSISTPRLGSQDGRSLPAGLKRVHMPQVKLEPVKPSSFPPSGRVNMSPPSFDINDVSLPMHSDELGRFPLHPAFNSNPGPSTAFSAAGGWASLGGSSGSTSAAPGGVGAFAGVNPADTIFGPSTMSPASTYQAPANYAQYPPSDQQSPINNDIGSSSAHNTWETFPNMLDNDTEMMWSSAPTSMEWEDWGKYIMNMSGMNGSPNPSQPSY